MSSIDIIVQLNKASMRLWLTTCDERGHLPIEGSTVGPTLNLLFVVLS